MSRRANGVPVREWYQMPLRLPPPLAERVRAAADALGVSTNAYVVSVLETKTPARVQRATPIQEERIESDPFAV